MRSILSAAIVAAVLVLPAVLASEPAEGAATFLRSAQYDLASGRSASVSADDPTTANRVLDWEGAFREAYDPAADAWVETSDTYVAAAAVAALATHPSDENNESALKGADYLVAGQYDEDDGVTSDDAAYGGIRAHAPESVSDDSGDIVPTASTALAALALFAMAEQGAPATLPVPYAAQTLGLPEDYVGAAKKAADYLVNAQSEDGSFPFEYDPEADAYSGPATARNAALGIRALLAAHAATNESAYLDAAVEAAQWLATLQVIGVRHDGGFRSTADPTREDYNLEYVYETGAALGAFVALEPLAPAAIDYELAYQRGFSFLNQQKTGYGSGTVMQAAYDLAANHFVREMSSSGTAWALIFYAEYSAAKGVTVSNLPSVLTGMESLQNEDGSFARIEPDGTSPLEWVEDTALGLAAVEAAYAVL